MTTKKGSTYTLPNGKYTSDVKKYIKAWRAVTRGLEARLPECMVLGFDPSVQMTSKGYRRGGSFDLPMYVVNQILKLRLDEAKPVPGIAVKSAVT
jgi:hypothetical protein